ncbi:predicted protein [Naegleria gruberi]|uniref:Peptidyl-tRNA hydrolase n=1 Tax=Naegleria gruberi TaxID=5762 RepID=D2V1M8_NAEGR|nr:uncharacterized protein NAEGRDRAFT_62632 [Naegleria gruberi]EFC49187.1 predicted protein [Naegleria gruberi]|eukprot:XP_002681931.1 predicted protein [Naegleria gruberi strain NEG-M]
MASNVQKRLVLIGLGNPGDKYKLTRHNIGWMIVNEFIKEYSFPALRESNNDAMLSQRENVSFWTPSELRRSFVEKEIQRLRSKWYHEKKRELGANFDENNIQYPNFGNADIGMKQLEDRVKNIIAYPTLDVHCMLPLSFMNLSGGPVKKYLDMNGMKINQLEDVNRILVITDDVSQPFGTFKLKAKGTHGGHNGLRDIEAKLGTDKYHRLKVGIAPLKNPDMAKQAGQDLASFVLGNFTHEEQKDLPKVVSRGVEILKDYISFDFKYVKT